MLGWSGLKAPALALALVLLLMYGYQSLMWHWEFSGPVKSALGALTTAELEMPRLDGTVEVIATRQRIGSREIAAMLPMERMESAFLVWRLGGVANAAATAMGVDRRHHVVNAFLEGYVPFPVNSPWMAWYVIAQRKKYMFDHVQYTGLRDVWQTSKQAFHVTRGDCEDHAILLADWLIGAGYDAWVAVGTVQGEGHAWVVLFDADGTEYLLEATRKRRLRGLNRLPLTISHTEYHPRMRFNRDQFWYNTGSALTTSYRSSQWRLQSRFHRRHRALTGQF